MRAPKSQFLITSAALWKNSVIQQIFQAFFLINYTNLSELVRTGKLNFLLVQPVNTRFVVPMLLVSTVPVKVLANKISGAGPFLLLLVMSLASFGLSEWGWRCSVRRYTSASS